MITVKDNDTIFPITYDDMVKYHGRSFIAGVAMAYKLLELICAVMADDILIRGKLKIVLGVNGPGIIDGIELATRAKSRGTLAVDQQITQGKPAPDAADGQGGKYYFEIEYAGKQMTVMLKQGLVPQEFLDLAAKTHEGTITELETVRLQQLKEEIAADFMTMEAKTIFDYIPA